MRRRQWPRKQNWHMCCWGGWLTACAPNDMTQSRALASSPMVWGWYLHTRLGRRRSAGDGMGRSRWSPWSAENVMWVVKQRLKRGGLKYRTLWYIFYIMDSKGNLRFRTHIKLVLFFAVIRLWPQNKNVLILDNLAVTCIFRQIAFPVWDFHSYFFWCDILLATS
jgi:hypothetical protein